MKISKFQFEDKSLEWRLEELLLNKLTLLVGASGVGKTQILRALMELKEIAEGESINGVEWNIEFETLSKQKYIWQGEFENKGVSIFPDGDNEDKSNKPKIIFEKLFLDDALIVDRTSDTIIFNGQPTIKLSQQESILSLLKEEERVKPAHEGLKKLHFADHTMFVNLLGGFRLNLLNANKLTKKYSSLKKIQESELDIGLKLFFLQKADGKTFSIIRQRFMDIFPQVEDIKIAPLDTKDKEMSNLLKDYPFIQIKEKSVKNWISENRISSGMLRTLMQLSELYLCAEGTVFLIDEFENSLGINCINEITNDILASRRQLQFILTSHHPYIIDAISFNNWKLVTRNAGIIKTHNIDKFGIGKSKHSAFMQLIQLEEYQTGQEQL
ncbi:AAA family ATPase [Hugenholtzia roseola]|uniref:AAA family ATPase n=1 Tax=Hugenholtzia roseola TaxID=1002 RepID=UPI000402E9D1|nr:AAA family ATPase [Hugenholtzia roseola]